MLFNVLDTLKMKEDLNHLNLISLVCYTLEHMYLLMELYRIPGEVDLDSFVWKLKQKKPPTK